LLTLLELKICALEKGVKAKKIGARGGRGGSAGDSARKTAARLSLWSQIVRSCTWPGAGEHSLVGDYGGKFEIGDGQRAVAGCRR
jgi:hypothetical protein